MKNAKKKTETPPSLKNKKQQPDTEQGKEDFSYPASEDIYVRDKELQDIDPESLEPKAPNVKPDARNRKDFKDDVLGRDLDVPGSELDDEQEDIGSEDEENNYYSLGDNNTKV